MIAEPTASRQEIDFAAEALRAGRPVVFPTDTVYGIGVAVRYADSPQAIYDIKQRDEDKPVAWLVDGLSALDEYGLDVPAQARELAEAHWPGALTVIVKASKRVPRSFQADGGTIGLRMPASETALALIRAVGPLAASSANLAGKPAPRAFADLDPRVIGRAGACVRCDTAAASGIASTVIDCSTGGMRVIRAGDILS